MKLQVKIEQISLAVFQPRYSASLDHCAHPGNSQKGRVRADRVSFPGPRPGAGPSARPGSRSSAPDAGTPAALQLRRHQLRQRAALRQHRQEGADELVVVVSPPTVVHLIDK